MNSDYLIRFFRRLYLGGFFVLLVSLMYYQVLNGDYYLRRARNNYVRVIPQRSIRGNIFDRNANILAYDRASFNIAVIPYQIKGKEDVIFSNLSNFMHCDLNALHKNYNRKLQNLFSPVDIISDIDKVAAFKLKERFGDDILIDPQPERQYIYPYEFAHLLGYVKNAAAFYANLKQYGYTPLERIGFSGIEQYYDDYLRGQDGGDLIEVNARGKIVGLLGVKNAKKGKDVYLTVDYRIQKAAYEAIAGKKGTIIFMDSRNGEILALVSFPSFDPGNFIRGKDVARFLNAKDKPMHNRAIGSTYPLGSAFKPIVLTAAIQEGKISPHTTFVCKGKFNIGRADFHCEKIHDEENAYEGLAHSCNVYFYNLGIIVGRDIITQWAKKFGLDSLTDIDLPYEKKGIIPFAGWNIGQRWYMGDTLNLAIGQGYTECSPIEILLAINVFANEGYLVKPRVLKSIADTQSATTHGYMIGISKNTIAIVKKALVGVVEKDDGTAHMLKALNLKIAGKTGTAQTKSRPHGWFVGFFPYDEPKYSLCVFLENGGSSYEALKVAYQFLNKLKEEKIF